MISKYKIYKYTMSMRRREVKGGFYSGEADRERDTAGGGVELGAGDATRS